VTTDHDCCFLDSLIRLRNVWWSLKWRHKTIYCTTEPRDQYVANGLAVMLVWKYGRDFFLSCVVVPFFLHKVIKNKIEPSKKWTRKWHEVLHVHKWTMFGDHPYFTTRGPQSSYLDINVSTFFLATYVGFSFKKQYVFDMTHLYIVSCDLNFKERYYFLLVFMILDRRPWPREIQNHFPSWLLIACVKQPSVKTKMSSILIQVWSVGSQSLEDVDWGPESTHVALDRVVNIPVCTNVQSCGGGNGGLSLWTSKRTKSFLKTTRFCKL